MHSTLTEKRRHSYKSPIISVLDGRDKAGVTISSGAEVDQQTHHTLGSLTLSTQYPRHISIFCAIFEKGRALKIVKDA